MVTPSARARALPKKTPQAAMMATLTPPFHAPDLREEIQRLHIMARTIAQKVMRVNSASGRWDSE
jgi:hypothetical protein